jgi:antitoxin YefM
VQAGRAQRSACKPTIELSIDRFGLEVAMAHVTYTEFRQNLASLMDDVVDSRAPLVVTRQGHRNVVVMSEEEFEGWMETVHLLRSPANAARLLQSIAQAETGDTVAHDLIER